MDAESVHLDLAAVYTQKQGAPVGTGVAPDYRVSLQSGSVKVASTGKIQIRQGSIEVGVRGTAAGTLQIHLQPSMGMNVAARTVLTRRQGKLPSRWPKEEEDILSTVWLDMPEEAPGEGEEAKEAAGHNQPGSPGSPKK